MMLRSSGKPPLARSPIRLRPRRKPLQTVADTPPGSLTKSQVPNRSWDVEESGLRPEYQTISCELQALAKMVQQELRTTGSPSVGDGGVLGGKRSPLFERGRLYDEYSARRNERLMKRRKREVEANEKKHEYNLGVRVVSTKKREASKFDSKRKSAAAAAAAAVATPMTERREARTPRYSLRSTCKENKKPPPIPMASINVEKSVGITERRVRRTRNA